MDVSKLDRDQQMDESVELRRNYIAGSCQLHYNQSPLKIASSQGAYLIDDLGSKLLDCATRLSNVGHCHPSVVSAGRSAMQTTGALHNNSHHQQYVEAILKTLPSNFEVCLFTNSGSEANDLALQLARHYTRRKGVAVMDNSFHGSSTLLTQICPKDFHKMPDGKPDWITVVPLPDTFRGKYSKDIYASQKYTEEAKLAIQRGMASGGEIAGFLSEPIFMVQGMILPPTGWLSNIYSYFKSLGTLLISDEIQLGFGRCGPQFWAFETQDVVPDILTIGKGMANGYPLSAVITSRKIAESMPRLGDHYHCESVAAAVGYAVLKTILDEDLVQRGLISMKYMHEKFLSLKNKHLFIGDVRIWGMVVCIDVVWNKESKKPDRRLAEKISYRLKENNIIVANEGFSQNILTFMPPFCISTHDVDFLVTNLTRVLAEIEIENSTIIFDEIFTPEPSTSSSTSRMDMAIPGNTYHMEEQFSPEPTYEYSFSDEEARREAEAYADMD